MILFGSFRPTEWREEAYTKDPPFSVETASDRAYVVPRDYQVESVLDRIARPLGLKKTRQEQTRYLVSRGNILKGLREFDWYVRRSWQNKEFSTLWALAYLGEKREWSEGSIRLEHVADVAGLTAKECGETLQKLFRSSDGNSSKQDLAELASDTRLIEQTMEKKVDGLPIWTEEVVMSALCAGPGGSVSQLYEAVLPQGLSIGAVYKLSERLKIQGYVYTQRHYRVNERGPMRELLSPDCRNCFFGYSSSEGCLADTLRQIEDILEQDYGRRPTDEEKAAFYNSARAVPNASRTNRKVLDSLKLMREIESMTREANVSTMLRKIQEGFGVEFPIKVSEESGQQA